MTYEELYMQIRKAYNSPWIDTKEEIKDCYFRLKEGLKTVSPQKLIEKAKAAALAHEGTKMKTTKLIEGEYWIIEYPSEKQPQIKRYDPYQV